MKDCTTCKYGFVDEQLGFPMCHHPKRFSEDCVDFNMHEEVEEPKKTTGIEEKKLPEGLEKAAEKYAQKEYPNEPSCGQWGTGDYEPPVDMEYPREIATDAFIAGAEWGRTKTMEKAVEIEVKEDAGGFPIVPLDAIELYDYEKDKPLAKAGDKVKVIVIKEDEL